MSYYDLLGVSPEADEEVLQKVISQQAAQWSKRSSNAASVESRHQAERTLQAIQEARQVLLKPERRAEYDRSLPAPAAAGPSQQEAAVPTAEERQPCPFCLESIHPNAKKCRWCNEWLDGSAQPKAPPKSVTPPAPQPAATAPVAVRSQPTAPIAPPPVQAAAIPLPIEARKSRSSAAVLGFFFGPFGLFYISAGQGWGALILWVILCAISAGALGVLGWIMCAVWGWGAASSFNKNHGHPH